MNEIWTATYADSIRTGNRFPWGYGIVTAAADAVEVHEVGCVTRVRVVAYVHGNAGRTFVADFPRNAVVEVAA